MHMERSYRHGAVCCTCLLLCLQVVVPERSAKGDEGGDVTQPYLLADVYTRHPLPFTRKVRQHIGTWRGRGGGDFVLWVGRG
jgi:hypothetical protein